MDIVYEALDAASHAQRWAFMIRPCLESGKFALPPLHLTLHPYKLLNIPILSFLPKTKLHFMWSSPPPVFTHGF
jgi:hypothetical protein